MLVKILILWCVDINISTIAKLKQNKISYFGKDVIRALLPAAKSYAQFRTSCKNSSSWSLLSETIAFCRSWHTFWILKELELSWTRAFLTDSRGITAGKIVFKSMMARWIRSAQGTKTSWFLKSGIWSWISFQSSWMRRVMMSVRFWTSMNSGISLLWEEEWAGETVVEWKLWDAGTGDDSLGSWRASYMLTGRRTFAWVSLSST